MTDGGQDRGRQGERAPLHVLFTTMAVAALLAIAAATWLPVGELLPASAQSNLRGVQQVLPQGWAFFTKSPRGDFYAAYRFDGGEWETANRGPNAQPRWAFGLNRESRLTEFDVQTALANAADDWWQDCARTDTDTECLADSPSHAVTAYGHDLRLCGDVGLVRREAVPWAYREFQKRTDGSSLRLEITCEEPR